MEQSYAIGPFVDAYRAAFAPVQRAQQEGLNALGLFARFQYAIAGDLLEHNLAGVQAMVSAATPAEYFAKQGQLNARFVGKVATHTREFLKEASDRSVPDIAPPRSTDLALPVEEEIIGVEEQEERAAQLLEAGEISEHEPSVESLEAQPEQSSTPKSTTAKQGKKRSHKPRRGHAHH
jgi:hypothetical protein